MQQKNAGAALPRGVRWNRISDMDRSYFRAGSKIVTVL